MKPIRILLLLALLSGPCLTARAQKVEPLTLEDSASWSMVLLPDPQSYVKYGYNQPLLEVMTRWIRYNVERLNIRLVLCTGDMVEENFRTVSGGDGWPGDQPSTEQWESVSRSFGMLDDTIPYILCTGNHDPLSLWQQDFFALPPSATMLAADRPDFALYERDGRPFAVIGGRGYPNKVWSPNENIAEGITRAAAIRALGPRAAEAPFAVGVLHTGLTFDPVKAPTDPVALLRAGFDYWALGHIHKWWVNDERAPRIAFSGCIQGRDVRETGPRGVNLVTLAVDAPPKVSFIPTASVVWEKVRIDVSDCTNIPALVSKTMRELFAVNGDASCEMMVSRIILTGATSLHEVLGRPGVLEEVRASLNDAYSEFYCDSLIDETTAPIDEEALRAEGLFPAVFLRTVDRLSEDVEGQIDYLQEEYLARNVPLTAALSEKKARQLTNEAARLVLDLLLQGGDDR